MSKNKNYTGYKGKSKDKYSDKPKRRHTKISKPFWQSDSLFSEEKLGKIPREYKSKVSRFNRKYKKD